MLYMYNILYNISYINLVDRLDLLGIMDDELLNNGDYYLYIFGTGCWLQGAGNLPLLKDY